MSPVARCVLSYAATAAEYESQGRPRMAAHYLNLARELAEFIIGQGA